MSIEDDPNHAAYQAAIAKSKLRPLPEGRPSEEPTSPATPETDGSPLSVREHMARLVVDATKLGEVVRDAKVRADEAMVLYRKHRDELDETTRILKAYERIRQPRRRAQKP